MFAFRPEWNKHKRITEKTPKMWRLNISQTAKKKRTLTRHFYVSTK
jgi:hypothetical protein